MTIVPDTADVIVVGAGSAGSALAALLSQERARRVVVLEAGGSDRSPVFGIPLLTKVLVAGASANWRYFTEPVMELKGRRIFWPRGKVLGGSSSINGMFWMRGQPRDYDGWARYGVRGWGWAEVLPAFKAIETFESGASEFHGDAGAVRITDAGPIHRLYRLNRDFVQAGIEAGLPLCQDFNSPPFQGVGLYHFNIFAGRRWSAARAFLRPAAQRPNLKVLTRAHVARVLVRGGRVTGVAARISGSDRIIASPEVVLCGGVINSPQLLMLSGIGPARDLKALRIPVAVNLPGVGKNLQDHLGVRVERSVNHSDTLHGLLRADRMAIALAYAAVLRRGPAATQPMRAGFLLDSEGDGGLPDLQAFFVPGLPGFQVHWPWGAGSRANGVGHGYYATVCNLHPQSRGSLSLRSDDPFTAPAIRPAYLQEECDRRSLRSGVTILREIFGQRPFDVRRGQERAPGPEVRSAAELDEWIARTADTVFHPVGTCRLGVSSDPGAVVDEQLNVFGVQGLKVADASIIPELPSANTNAPSIMIGYRCGQFMS